MITLSFIIVNYNTAALVIQAITSIKTCIKNYTYEIIVVDNSENQDRIKSLIKDYEAVTFIDSRGNIGFGRANNLGARQAIGKYLMLLNSDAKLVDEASITLLIKTLESSEKTAIVGPSFIKEDGSENYAYGHFLSLKKIMTDQGFLKTKPEDHAKMATYLKCDFTQPTVVDYLGAAGILVKKEITDKIGLFDPKYFLYFEDMDLGWNIVHNGYQSVIVPDAKVIHLGGKSSTTTKNDFLQGKIKESKRYFIKKRYGTLGLAFVIFFEFIHKLKHTKWKKAFRQKIYLYLGRVFRYLDKKIYQNKDFVVISDNCWGAELYKRLDVEYNTPFVGLFIYGPDYINLLKNLDHYLNTELSFKEESKWIDGALNYPIGYLEDIEIHFMHYKDENEAYAKWYRRLGRMKKINDKDKYYFKICDRDLADLDIITQFHELPFKHKISFGINNLDQKHHIKIQENEHNKHVPDGISLYKATYKYVNILKWINSGTFSKANFYGKLKHRTNAI